MLTTLVSMAALAGPSLGIEAPGDGCTHPDMAALSWMVGDWAVTRPDSILAMGEIGYQPIWGACSLVEQQGAVYEAIRPLGEGLGLLKFNSATENWTYSFAGDGVTMTAEGRHDPQLGLRLEGWLQFVSDGHQRAAQVSWQPVEPGGIEHRIAMLDTDSGAYMPWQTVLLRPLDTTPRPRAPQHWREEK